MKNVCQNFEKAKIIILNKGGEYLTPDLVNNQYVKIKIKCKDGHVWETNSKNIINNYWCAYCYNKNRSQLKLKAQNKLPEIIKFCENKKGRCLSLVYLGRHSKLHFECEFGHQWYNNWATLLNGYWCRKCKIINDNLKSKIPRAIYSLQDLQKIASEKGGECLATEYSGSKKLLFRCSFFHEWMAKSGNIIKRNSWCPMCASSLYERICRLYFESLFEEKFPTCYPIWLKNKQGHQLELDGFCEKLNLAFEHQGKQHYSPINFNGKSNEFEQLQLNDVEKKKNCEKQNVKLILIPELVSLTKLDQLRYYIKKQCVDKNVIIPMNFDSIIIDHNKVHSSNKDQENLEKLKNKLLNKNYELLSSGYIGACAKYNVKCLNCNNVNLIHYSALIKSNCIFCRGGKKINTIEDSRNLAKLKNGKCLSAEYKNNHTKMIWECHLGHKWNSTYNCVQKTWCPDCFKQNKGKSKILGIEIYKNIALAKGGLCLSESVNSCHDKLQWQCAEGHIWFSQGCSVKNTNHWCPKCAIIRNAYLLKSRNITK